MALDPRISMAVRVPDISNTFGIFQDAMEKSKQIDRNDAAAPFRQQLLEQKAASGQAQATDERNQRRLLNLHQTGQRLKPLLESGDTQGAQKFLLDNISQLQTRIEAGEDIDITESMETLAKLQQGDAQGVLADIGAIEGLFNKRGASNTQFGGQQTFKDSKGNLFFGTTKRNPNTGEVQSVLSAVDGSESKPDGSVNLVTSAGETAEERDKSKVGVTQEIQDIKTTGEGKTAAIKAGVKQAEKAFEKIPVVRTAIGNYDEAIAALDAGADTGTITRLLPSMTAAGKTLDNTIKRLGLDVVGNTTFGALSESELAFALQAAIPDNLSPPELKKWLSAKKNAQQKVLDGLDEVSIFLGDGTKTITDWKNQQAIKKLANEDAGTPINVAPVSQPTQKTGGVIMTDASGNRAMVYPDGSFEEL